MLMIRRGDSQYRDRTTAPVGWGDHAPENIFGAMPHILESLTPRTTRRRPRVTHILPLLIALVASNTATAQRAGIPTPESVFGFPIGKDSNLVDYEQSIAYFKKLEAATNRVH